MVLQLGIPCRILRLVGGCRGPRQIKGAGSPVGTKPAGLKTTGMRQTRALGGAHAVIALAPLGVPEDRREHSEAEGQTDQKCQRPRQRRPCTTTSFISIPAPRIAPTPPGPQGRPMNEAGPSAASCLSYDP